MELFIAAGALVGAIIGRYFKVLILIPICVIAAALLWMKCQSAENSVLDSLGKVGLLILSLEFGYFTGLLSTDISAAAHRLSEFRVRPRQAPRQQFQWFSRKRRRSA
jgi:hypothetical protein